jgi:catechol 2,3-dioxygenase-like lactoylglutathione lyase family enzyme
MGSGGMGGHDILPGRMNFVPATALALALFAPAWAQLAPPNEAGMSMGHIHLNVSDVEAQTRFWVSQFDAKPLRREGLQGVKVPGMLILFNPVAPNHSSDQTVLDHFGFKVRSRDEMVASCKAGGYTISKLFKGSEGFPNAYVIGPDGVNVELQEDTLLKVRAVAQHLHFLLPEYLPLRAWYTDTFSMQPTHRGTHDSADIPGMNLTFAPSHARTLGTKGGIIDHIGFEVVNLEAYCKKLEAAGVKFDEPYKKVPALGIARAFLTDPHGVLIELTEGLGAY